MSWCRRYARALVACVLLTAGRAGGDEALPAEGAPPVPEAPPRARSVKEYTEAGVRLFAEGRYDEALKSFAAAYVLRPNPVYLFNIAQCHRKAGRAAEAVDSYQLFLREAPASPLRAEAQGHLRALRPPPPAAPGPVPPGAWPRPGPGAAATPRPVTRRPWLWALLGGAAAGVAVGVGLGIGLAPRDPMTTTGVVVDPRF